jgi:hypothetical protein
MYWNFLKNKITIIIQFIYFFVMMLIHLFLKNLYAIYPIYPNVSQVSLGVGIVFRPGPVQGPG